MSERTTYIKKGNKTRSKGIILFFTKEAFLKSKKSTANDASDEEEARKERKTKMVKINLNLDNDKACKEDNQYTYHLPNLSSPFDQD